MSHQLKADALSLRFRPHRNIKDMRLTGSHTHDTVALDNPIQLVTPAAIPDPQAIAEYTGSPGVLIGTRFNRHYRIKVINRKRTNA
jgi:hypothetical protein